MTGRAAPELFARRRIRTTGGRAVVLLLLSRFRCPRFIALVLVLLIIGAAAFDQVVHVLGVVRGVRVERCRGRRHSRGRQVLLPLAKGSPAADVGRGRPARRRRRPFHDELRRVVVAVRSSGRLFRRPLCPARLLVARFGRRRAALLFALDKATSSAAAGCRALQRLCLFLTRRFALSPCPRHRRCRRSRASRRSRHAVSAAVFRAVVSVLPVVSSSSRGG